MRTRTPILLSLLVALVATGSLIVAGCGSSSGGGSDKDAQALLKQAFSKNAHTAARDANVKVALAADFKGGSNSQLKGPLTLQFGGPVKTKGKNKLPELDWTIKGAALGRTLDAGVVITADNAFVKYKGQNYEIGKSAFSQFKTQTESQANKNKTPQSLSDLGIDPNDFLTDLKKEDGQPVTGIPTERVTGTVDTEKAIKSFLKVLKSPAVKDQLQGRTPPQISGDQISKISDAVKGVDFSVDIDKAEKVVRRLNAKIEFNVPESSRQRAGGIEGGTFTFNIEIGKLDPSTQITGPANAKPISELTQQFGGLLGGLGGGATPGLGGGTTPGVPSTPGVPTTPGLPQQ